MLMELFNSILAYYIGSLSVIRGFGGGGAFQVICMVKTNFIITLRHYLLLSVLLKFALMVQIQSAIVGKTARLLA